MFRSRLNVLVDQYCTLRISFRSPNGFSGIARVYQIRGNSRLHTVSHKPQDHPGVPPWSLSELDLPHSVATSICLSPPVVRRGPTRYFCTIIPDSIITQSGRSAHVCRSACLKPRANYNHSFHSQPVPTPSTPQLRPATVNKGSHDHWPGTCTRVVLDMVKCFYCTNSSIF